MRPPRRGEGGGLDEELELDVAPVSADGNPDADFAGALRYADQHDIHNPDGADDEGNAGDPRQQAGQGARRGGRHLGDILLAAHGEIIIAPGPDAMPLAQKGDDLLLHSGFHVGIGGLGHVGANLGIAREPFHGGRIGDNEDIVLILTKEIEPFRLEQADDFEWDILHADDLPNRIGIAKDLTGGRRPDDRNLVGGADILFAEGRAASERPLTKVRGSRAIRRALA